MAARLHRILGTLVVAGIAASTAALLAGIAILARRRSG
jgi:hypothetical protein